MGKRSDQFFVDHDDWDLDDWDLDDEPTEQEPLEGPSELDLSHNHNWTQTHVLGADIRPADGYFGKWRCETYFQNNNVVGEMDWETLAKAKGDWRKFF